MRNETSRTSKTVLILTWFYRPFVGGAELFVEAMLNRLSDRYRFVVLTARISRRLDRREQHGNVEVIRCGLGTRWDKHLYPVFAAPTALRLIKRVDIVHTVMVNAAAVLARGLRLVVRRPSVLTLQMGDDDAYVRRVLGWLYPIYPRLHRGFDRVHAISRFLERRAIGFGVAPESITVIPNGVDLAKFHPPDERGEERNLREVLGLRDAPVVVSLSRLSAKNGMDTLVAAWAHVREGRRDAKLLILGDGEERQSLQAMIREHRLEDEVRLLGTVDPDEAPEYLRIADVFVRPSRSEGLGNAFLEAMACGVPIVATPVGGIVDFLEDGETGIACPPDEPDALAGAILRLLRDPELARRLSAQARKLVVERYGWDRIADEMDAVYRDLSP